MQENNMKSNNFFQRLFSFILSLTRGFKRVNATSHPLRRGSTAVPILTSVGPAHRATVQLHQAQTQAQAQAKAQIQAHEASPVETQTIEERERMREKKGKSVLIISGEEEEVKILNYPQACSRPPLRQRQVRPLFDVAVNINEKSDAFIRSRKEAMRRNYSSGVEIS